MNIDFENLFPQDISDETAFHLVHFIRDLSSIVNSHYFVQKIRHYESLEEVRRKKYRESAPF